MTHIAHKMPKASSRLGYRVGQMGRFQAATFCPFPPQKNPKINAKQSLTFIFVSLYWMQLQNIVQQNNCLIFKQSEENMQKPTILEIACAVFGFASLALFVFMLLAY